MSIVDEIQKIRLEFKSDLKSLSSENGELDNIRSKYIGRKGLVAELFNQMGSLSKEERPQFGKELNKLKVEFTDKIDGLVSNDKDVLEKKNEEKDKSIVTKIANFITFTSSIFFPIQIRSKLLNRVADA